MYIGCDKAYSNRFISKKSSRARLEICQDLTHSKMSSQLRVEIRARRMNYVTPAWKESYDQHHKIVPEAAKGTVPSSQEPIPLSYARFVTDRSCLALSVSPFLAPVSSSVAAVLNPPFFSLTLWPLSRSSQLATVSSPIADCACISRELVRLNSKRPVKRQRRVFCVVWNTCSGECCAPRGQRPVYVANIHQCMYTRTDS